MKNNSLVIVVLVLIVLGGVLVLTRRSSANNPSAAAAEQTTPTPTSTPTPRPQPPVAGDIFADSAIKSMAYQVFPGKLSDSAVVATKGFTFKFTLQKNGSTKVDFIPSEQEDKASSYIVKKGETLYFVEVNPGDDTDLKDIYLQDDYGVLVGADGTVQ